MEKDESSSSEDDEDDDEEDVEVVEVPSVSRFHDEDEVECLVFRSDRPSRSSLPSSVSQ